MKVRYTDRARIDLETAFEWYQGQRIGLGFEFLDCLEATISTIQQMPEVYAKHHSHFRRALIRRFPFAVFYTIENKEVIIHAIFDNRQDPSRIP